MNNRRLTLLTYLGLIGVAAGLILPVPHALGSAVWQPLFDIAHLPIFGGLAVWLLIRLRARETWRPMLVTMLVIAGIALLVELIQPISGRSGSLSDVLTGMAGALIATTAWRAWATRQSTVSRGRHAILSLGLAAAVLWPSLLQIGAWWWQLEHFPVLGDFESSLEQQLWKSYPAEAGNDDCPAGSAHGEHSLAVRTIPHRYSGARYQANDRDWTGYERLILELYVPIDRPRLALRIDDDGDTTKHDSRFNRALQLSEGWNRIDIALADIAAGPAHPGLDLRAIRQLLIYSGPDETQAGLFCVDFARLE